MKTTRNADLLSQAIDNAFSYSLGTGRPVSLKGCIGACYLVLSKPDVTFDSLDCDRVERGYTGRGAILRFEEEVLRPMVAQCEAEKNAERLQQSQIDVIVEHVLLGVPVFEEGRGSSH